MSWFLTWFLGGVVVLGVVVLLSIGIMNLSIPLERAIENSKMSPGKIFLIVLSKTIQAMSIIIIVFVLAIIVWALGGRGGGEDTIMGGAAGF